MHLVANLARNLQAVRRRRKLSQEQLAEKAGVSVSYISMLEREMRSPRLETIEDLADALDVSPEALLGSKGSEQRR